MKKTLALIISALTTCIATSSYGTPTLGVDFTAGSGGALNDGDFMLGYTFTVNAPITVTGLAFWDATAGGNLVGLWDSSGTLLASANVTSSDPTLGSAGLNYANISAVTLSDGNYTVLGNNNGEVSYLYAVSGLTTISQITYTGGQAGGVAPNTLAESTGIGYGGAWFGGDIVVGGAASTPDSGTTIALMGMALAGLGLVRRKLQN